MKFLIKNIFTVFISLMVLLAGCEGPVGPAGPVGPDGAAGADGANGANGIGRNGTGINQLIALGGMTITFSGTTPELEEPFERILAFPYSSVQEVNSNVYEEEGDLSFEATRWYGVPSDNNLQDNMAGFGLYVDGQAEPDTATYFYLFANTRIIEDAKAFPLQLYNEYEISNDEITEYSYNPATGELSFHFEVVIPAYNNTTGFDLTATGDVNIIVLEELDCPAWEDFGG